MRWCQLRQIDWSTIVHNRLIYGSWILILSGFWGWNLLWVLILGWVLPFGFKFWGFQLCGFCFDFFCRFLCICRFIVVVVGCCCGGEMGCCHSGGVGGGFGKMVVDWQWWVYGFGCCVCGGWWAFVVVIFGWWGLLVVSSGGTVMWWLLVGREREREREREYLNKVAKKIELRMLGVL